VELSRNQRYRSSPGLAEINIIKPRNVMTMDNDIMEATLVDSDDDPESDAFSGGRRRADRYENSTSERSRRSESRRGGRRRDDREFTGEEEGEDDGVEEDGEGTGEEGEYGDNTHSDEDDDTMEDGPEPVIKKAKVLDEPPKRKLAVRESQYPSKQLQMAAVCIVAIIILSTFYLLVLRSEEDLDVTVNVPELKLGDEARYGVSGSLDISGYEDEPLQDEVTSGNINLKGSSMSVKAEGIETVTDGYYYEYESLKTYTYSNWQVDGWIDTVSNGIVDIDGTIQVTNNAYRNGDTILLNEIEAQTNIEAKSRDVGFYTEDIDSEDTLRTYSSESGDLQASFDDIIHTTDLKKGMSGEFTNDDLEYKWEASGNAKVYGARCVIVTFTLIDPIPPDLDIKSQSIKLYLSNKHPFPVKTELDLVVGKAAHQGKVTVKYSMTMNRYVSGSTTFVLPEDQIIKESPYQDLGTMKLFPPTGVRENSSISFELKDAHEFALEESDLEEYLDSHSDAYLVQGIYNETDGPVWNLTYSYLGSDTGYVVIVTESKVEDKGEMKLADAGSALEVNSEALDFVNSWSGAEQILKHDDEVKDNCFTGEKINLHDCNFGVRTRLYQPSVDLVSMFASAPRVDYGFTITKGDEFAAGVDAETGQLLFVATHDGPPLV